MKTLAGLTCVFCLSTPFYAADWSVSIVDKSTTGAPLVSAGIVTVSLLTAPTGATVISHRDDWKATNTSAKPVVALVATLLITFQTGTRVTRTARYDAYFHPTIVQPGDEVDLYADSLGGQITKAGPSDLGEPVVDVTLRWVQFSDGTVFGDSQYGADLVRTRRDIRSALTKLDQVYRTQGGSAFLAELEKPVESAPDADTYIEHLRIFEKQNGIEATVNQVEQHLKTAQQRASL